MATTASTSHPDEKSPIRLLATSAIVALLLYAVSFGPAIWLVDRKVVPTWTTQTISVLYYPIFWVSMAGPRPVREAVRWYAELGAKRKPEYLIDDPRIPSGIRH
jgi:hypothetical protein